MISFSLNNITIKLLKCTGIRSLLGFLPERKDYRKLLFSFTKIKFLQNQGLRYSHEPPTAGTGVGEGGVHVKERMGPVAKWE